MEEKIVVIGGTAAGVSAASRAKKINPSLKIVVYEKTGYTSYGSCGLPYYLGGLIDDAQKLIALTPEEIENKRGIEVHIHHEITSINPKEKTVSGINLITKVKFVTHYDKLIIATGASPLLPPIEGIVEEEKLVEGVFVLRNVEEGIMVKKQLKQGRNIVLVGGGNIGLEVAEQLCQLENKKITIIEGGPRILPDFPEQYSELVHQSLEEKAVKIYTGHFAKSIERKNGKLVSITTHKGERIPADTVLLATGVYPQSQLAKEAGLALDEFGAIKVNEQLQTQNPFIWACGDCTSVVHQLTGKRVYIPLGTYANKQGRIAGRNVAGGSYAFQQVLGSQGTKVFDWYIASTGLSQLKGKEAGFKVESVSIVQRDRAGYYPGGEKNYITLIFEEKTGKILGAQGIGGASIGGRINAIATAIHQKMTLKDLNEVDFLYTPAMAPIYDPVLIAVENGLKKLKEKD